MELTPKVFREVQFREKLRGGYHPEDVDEFLEQAALGAEALLEQLRQANERALRAERVAAEASSADDALKKMLLMAQRTADQAVREAQEEADRLLAESRAQAEAVLADHEERGRASYEAAVNDRRATMESADAALAQAQQEVEALQGWVALHRNHLLNILKEAESLIENAGLVSDPPAVTPLPPELLGHEAQDSGTWDPHYLDDLAPAGSGGSQPDPFVHGGQLLEGEHAAGGEHSPPPGPDGGNNYTPWHSAGMAPGTEQVAPDQGQAADDTGPYSVAPVGQSGDKTMAMDERALDTFFSGHDMGDDRGLGRFRRRQ